MANDVYQLIIAGNAEQQFWESVLHFQSGTANSSTPLTVANKLILAFEGAVQDTLLDCMGTDANITGYKSKRVNNTGGPQFLNPTTPAPGTFGSTCSIASVSGVVLSYYTQGTKTRSGRWFLPGMPTAAYDNGVFTNAFHSAVAALISNLTGTITNGGETFNFGVWADKTKTFFAPTLVRQSGHLGTQRRRLLPLM